MERLPIEIQHETLIDLTPNEIFSYCKTNRKARGLCENEAFWNQKSKHDFGHSFSMISNLSPYQKYRFMHILEEQLASLYLFIHNKKVTKKRPRTFC